MAYTLFVATDRNHKVGVVIPDSESPPARERDKKVKPENLQESRRCAVFLFPILMLTNLLGA